jgi:hypothetical protein
MKILEKQYKYKIIGIPFCYSFQKYKVNKVLSYTQVIRNSKNIFLTENRE